jgi:hypothetical protein
LVDTGRNLETLVEDSTLTLDTDVLWPSDESGKVSGGADVSPDGLGARTGWEEWVSLLYGSGGSGFGGSFLSGGFLGSLFMVLNEVYFMLETVFIIIYNR